MEDQTGKASCKQWLLPKSLDDATAAASPMVVVAANAASCIRRKPRAGLTDLTGLLECDRRSFYQTGACICELYQRI